MSELLKATQNLMPVLRELALDAEQSGRVAEKTVAMLRDHRLMNLLTPRSYNGQELGFGSVFEITQELAKGCMSTAWVATVGNVHNWMATGFSEAAQNEYFADTNVYSSASFAPTGQATMTPDGFIANGRWGFLSGVDHAQWAFICALVSDSIDDRPAGPWFLMVPINDLQVDHDSWQVAGLRATGSKDVVLDNVEVPGYRAAFLPKLSIGQGPGAHLHQGATYKTPFQPALIAVLAVPILGAARQAVTEFTQYTSRRVVKMTGAKQADQAPTQIVLAEVAAAVDAAGLILADVFKRLDDGKLATPLEFAVINRDAAYAARLLLSAVNTIMQNSGGGALQTNNPIQRIWRDVTAASNHAALNWPSQAQNWGVAALADTSAH